MNAILPRSSRAFTRANFEKTRVARIDRTRSTFLKKSEAKEGTLGLDDAVRPWNLSVLRLVSENHRSRIRRHQCWFRWHAHRFHAAEIPLAASAPRTPAAPLPAAERGGTIDWLVSEPRHTFRIANTVPRHIRRKGNCAPCLFLCRSVHS